ncbi:hypothetical protein [Streptomyces fumanus]|uniref:hypothetical protein n=1 Tax=Streptomyces fumanus TaxID=67302 RepID=UPI0033D5D651
MHLVHDGDAPPAALLEAAVTLRDEPAGRATVLVAAVPRDGELDDFAHLLAPLVGGLRARGVGGLRLVMSRGAVDRAEEPSPARRLCEDWGLEVIAPSGRALVVPGGTLFSPDDEGAQGGWWHFAPGAVPRRLGARLPPPGWERHLSRVPSDVAGDHVVRQVPAGLLIRPAKAPAEDADALGFAVPVDPARPLVLVDAGDGPDIPADAVADILAAMPRPARQAVTLAPADGRDLLALGQETADVLGLDVRVASGLPVLLEEDPPDARARTVIVGPDGAPAWEPYVESVTCLPAPAGQTAPEPTVDGWRPPVPGLGKGARPGVFLLDDRWQTTSTWSGIWVGRHEDHPPRTARSAAGDAVTIELGVPGRAVDDSLWDALEPFFEALEDDVRERAVIQVHGNTGAAGLRALRRLAVRHGMVLAPRGRRTGAPQAPAPVLPSPLARRAAPPAAAAPVTEPAPPSQAAPIAPPVQYVTTTGGAGPADYSPATEPASAPGPVPEPPAAGSSAGHPVAPWAVPARIPGTADRPAGHRPGREGGPEARAASAAAQGSSPPRPAGGTPAPSVPASPEPAAFGAAVPDSEGTRPAPGPWDPPGGAEPEPAPDPWASSEGARPEPAGGPWDPPGGAEPEPAPDPWASSEGARPEPAGGPWAPPGGAEPVPGAGPWASSGGVRSGADSAPWTLPDGTEPVPVPPPGREATPLTGLPSPVPSRPEPLAPPHTFTDPDVTRTPSAARPAGERTRAQEPGDTASQDPPPAPPSGATAPHPDRAVLHEVTYVPVLPDHRSSASERQMLRAHLGQDWERHSSAAHRVLTALPGLRTAGAQDGDPAADLAALYAYLGSGRPGERELATGLAHRDPGTLAYLGCLASGLGRLPSFRGAAVLTAGVFDEATLTLLPGEEVGAATPVVTQGVDPWYPGLPDDHYLIWSSTGRRAAHPAGPGGAGPADVVFGPGSRFRVLEVRERGEASVVLLREVPVGSPPGVPGMLDDSDLSVLERLRALADRPAEPVDGALWPAGRQGLLGIMADPSPGRATP